MATIEERLYEIIAESLSVEKDDIKSDSSFIDDLDADSLDVVEMIMAMESEFSTDDNDLEISDEEAENIVTVADALAFLEGKGITD
ncbi:MAG: acyl carrier protein [Dehalococcoidia bacterium]|nr:acyl carrier protein [Dehalococcoidia bacterium]MEC7921298.1 acyl carrier protein [Chloroflexota bacterium]MEC9451007.1 acyl carrier protein [Chloroflexota bacterium]MQG04393.1 acyl carrier protein [SAR202 cluster bacterium]|tara:strand:+ start:126 stop:383 length:258 start_codon:yes stop_codon:yes gene_type:complete